MIHFECDYLEGCAPEILERMRQTNFEQTAGYGEDPHCARAKVLVRNACEAPDADVHFLVGGTQTNVTVISSTLRPYQGVLCSDRGHINMHETGAVEHGGHKVLTLPSKEGKIAASQIDNAMKNHFADPSFEHIVQPGMVYISFSTELGTIYSKDELLAIRDVCTRWELPLFIDGARLGYGLEAEGCDVTLPDIASIADIFYIGGTKQGALFGEAVVIRNESLKKHFRYNIKQNGGMLAKGRLLGIQFETLFEDGLYFRLAQHADRLAGELKRIFREMGFPFLATNPTNQVFPIMPNALLESIKDDFSYEFWENVDDSHTAVRFCTSWATGEDSVKALETALKSLKQS